MTLQKETAGSQCRVLVPNAIETEAEDPVEHDPVEPRRGQMVVGMLDSTNNVPSWCAPASSSRIDIDGPTLRAVHSEQRWVMLGVWPTTNEQHFTDTLRDGGDQRALQMDAIWKTGSPKLAIPRPEAMADSPRQNRARHSAPQRVSGMPFNVLYVPHALYSANEGCPSRGFVTESSIATAIMVRCGG
jgi:hypothetical protein